MITFHLFSWALYFNSNCYNTSDFYFNKNIFTQIKYNIPASIFYIDAEQNQKYIPNSKNASNDSNTCISIFDYGNIFLKSKTNVDEDKKENFRMKTVKKGLVFAMIQYAMLKFTYHQCFARVQLKLWNRVFW